MEKLKKGSSVPLYKQLFEVIEQQISDGELKEGQQLMTEAELSAEYGVSRITVRKALELLVEDGSLVKRQGVGAFVAERKMHRRVEGIMGFTQNCAAEGKKAGAVLLAAELAEPTVKDIENLQIKSNEKVIRIVRLRLSDDVPVILEEVRFSQKYAFLMGQDLTTSIYQMLADQGISLGHSTMEVEICYANEEESRLLEVKEREALLVTKSMVYSQQGEPVHYCKNTINLSRYKMTVII